MQRITDLTRGLVAILATLGLLVGIPMLLVAMVGWPFPTTAPSLDLIQRHLNDGDLPDTFVIKLLAVIVWMVWSQLAIGLLVEIRATIVGRAARRAPILPGIQLFAARLITWATLVLTALSPARPVLASPLMPVEAIAPLVLEHPAEPVPVGPATQSQAEPAPTIASFTHRTALSDSWWSIAETYLDDGLRWSDIRNLNLGRAMNDGTTIGLNTETVRPGWDLQLPADAGAGESGLAAADDLGEMAVTVEPGDHFWALAEERLADAWGRPPTDTEIAPYWVDVVAANEGRLLPPNDPNLIYPEQHFVLPPVPANPNIDVDLNGDRIVVPDPGEPTSDAGLPLEPTAPSETAPETAEPAIVEPEVAQPAPSASVIPEAASGTSPSDGSALGDMASDLARPLLLVAGVGLFGGLLLGTLRRLRHIQAARRRPGTVIDPPDEQSATFETEVRAISPDGEDARYLAATNRYLSHQLEQEHAPSLPAIVAARAGTHGVELLLDESCEPIRGFVPSNEQHTSWRLAPDITARVMEAQSDDAHPYAPGLLVVGTTEPGDLVIDFEQLGATTIEGDTQTVASFQRALIGSALVAPWATQNRIVAIGFDDLDLPDASRVERPDDPVAWATDIAEKTRNAARRADRSPYEERVEHGMVTFPTVVVVGPDPAHAGIAQHLAEVAELAYSDLTLVAAAPIASAHRIVIADGVATLEPQGIAFEPIGLTPQEVRATSLLLENAAETQTGPPPDWSSEDGHSERPRDEEATNPSELADDSGEADTSETHHVGEGEIEPPETIDTQIDAIMAPKPIEVRLLGRLPMVEGLTGEASPRLEAIICFLAFHGDVPAQRLRDEFWANSESRTGADTAMMRIRSLLGETAQGDSRLPSARGSGTYRLADVGCDWTRATQLLELAKTAESPDDEGELLDAVCELIDGHIVADAVPRHYAWLLRDPSTYTQMETSLVDAAHRRAELALEIGDVSRAKWAARKGLSIVDGQESLHRVQMRAAAEAGDTDGVKAAFREAMRAVESYGFDEEVQPETQALYESLTNSGTRSELDSADS